MFGSISGDSVTGLGMWCEGRDLLLSNWILLKDSSCLFPTCPQSIDRSQVTELFPSQLPGHTADSVHLLAVNLHSVKLACLPTCLTPLAVMMVDLPGHVVNDRGEVSGSVKTDRLETLVIGLHHPLDTAAVRVLRVAVLQTKPLVMNKMCLEKAQKSSTAVAKQRIPSIQS